MRELSKEVLLKSVPGVKKAAPAKSSQNALILAPFGSGCYPDRFSSLPDDLVILPAHYASTTEIDANGVVCGRLGVLRRTVPELQIRDETEFVEAMKKALQTPPPIYEQIIRVNLGERTVDEETATEWELGKNQCAASMRRAMENRS